MKYSLSENDVHDLQQKAKKVRLDVIQMISKAGSGHPGGSLSCVEILVTLFAKVLKHGPEIKDWNKRDHFHLSKGHVCPTLYSLLAHAGYFPVEELGTLRQIGSILQGHPHAKTPGVDAPSGSLGQGISIACGMAVAGKADKAGYSVFTLLGDGELQEGQVWEAAMFAAQYKLDNLCLIIDNNGQQIDGAIKDIMSPYPIDEKFKAFGFHVSNVDGHDIPALYDAFKTREEIKGKPTVIIAKTVKGKGISFMEGNLAFHGRATTDEETKQALKELDE
ncbi:MAG: transketolase [Candidatus Omnitrophica bacterium]|nr:transketolase [Candidatus Omnitrophota bacterium]